MSISPPVMLWNSSNAPIELSSPHSAIFDHLYPAILAVFVIIISGYFCGRNGIITDVEANGLSIFVSRFALPAMLFRAMATLDFGQVNWYLISGLLVGKSVVFFTVLILGILLSGKPIQLGRAGLFAILASQSNDFALGFPIVEALYKESHPELLQYIYLAAPISLVILNPIGFCLLEIERDRSLNSGSLDGLSKSNRCIRTSWNVLRGIFSNAINFMTFIGVIANLAFERKIPLILDNLLIMLGRAFPAAALFYLGLKMVGRIKSFRGFHAVVPVLLVVAKLIYLPLINRLVIGHLTVNSSSTEAYSNFGFLFGTFPTAPTAFVFASVYNKEIDTAGVTLVLSTFLSGPWMFVSAQMLSIPSINVEKYADLLSSTQFDVGIVGLFCSLWVLVVLVISKRCKRLLHSLVCGMLLSQALTCIGMLSWCLVNSTMLHHYVQFFLFFMGVSASRLWTAALALAFWLVNSRSLCFVLRLRLAFFVACFGIPIILTVILMAFGNHSRQDKNPAFHYGFLQVTLSAIILTICFLTTIFGVVFGQIARKRNLLVPKSSSKYQTSRISHKTARSFNQFDENDNSVQVPGDLDMEDLIEIKLTSDLADEDEFAQGIRATCSATRGCSADQRRKCRLNIRRYEASTFFPEDLQNVEVDPTKPVVDHLQQNRHLILLLSLSTSMLIGMFLCYWRIFAPNTVTSGIFIELEFLDGLLIFGQSCFVFAVFGMDTNFGILPWLKRLCNFVWRKGH